mgnify:CR=1 FL=1
MYTLLLVDDEEEVTRIIAKKVKWNDLGFSVTGHANNGLKALEMLEEMQPDVVMTDIRMPYMDGLELCGQIREKYPATKLVLFTGFDDFEYAKEAVHLEIEEYVLKPLNAAEITKVFEDLKKKSDADLAQELVNAKKELFNLRFQNATNQLDNTARIKEVRRNIARIQTVITEKARA